MVIVDWYGWGDLKLPIYFANADVTERWIRAFLGARPTGSVGVEIGSDTECSPSRFTAPAEIEVERWLGSNGQAYGGGR
jgi:hypothetical protein